MSSHSLTVLTGDIVASEALGRARTEDVLAALSEQATRLASWHGQSLHFTRTRGDGWQVVLARPAYALRSALAFTAAARALGKDVATRISAATGLQDMPQHTDLNRASGPVFTASGRGLDDMSPEMRLAHAGTAPHRALYRLADALSSAWTPPQAEAMRELLSASPAPTHTAIAHLLKKSRQTVAQALEGADAGAILWAIEQLEQADEAPTQGAPMN